MMANYRLIILFYLWIVFMADIVKSSDQTECNDMQCPPDIKCPSDSILIYEHVMYEPSQIPPDYDVNDDDDDIVDHNNNYNNNNNDYNGNSNNNSNNNNNNNKGTTNSVDINNNVIQNSKLKFNKIQHNYQNEHISTFVIDDDGGDDDDDGNDNDNINNDYDVHDNSNNNNHYLHSITHKLNKRNVQLKRKESIKIVPGDYISLIPDLYNIVNYDQQNLNNLQQNSHKKRKRNIDNVDDIPEQLPPSSSSSLATIAATSSSSSLPVAPSVLPLPSSTLSDSRYNLTAECCNPKRLCVCDPSACNNFPKCEKFGKITIEIERGTGEPGNCCTKYACIDREPNCKNLQPNDKEEFWLKHCMKCECISGERFCQNSCIDDDDDDASNVNGNSHRNSRKECFSAKKQRPYKNGEMWKEDSCTDCECVNGERICHISSCKSKDCKKQIKLPDECCPICVSDDSEFDSTVTEISSVTTSASSTSSSTSTTATSTASDSSKHLTENESTFQPTTLICNYTAMQPTTTEGETTEIVTSTTIATTTKGTKQKLSNSDRIFKLLGATKENLILYGIIIILLILCIIFFALYIHELTRKTSYRSIPSSDSNLCQIPRPLNNKPTTP